MEELLKAGVNVFRMNFSHGDFAEHQVKVDNAKAVSGKNRNPGGFIAGFGRTKIRIGDFYKESVILKEGQTFILTTEKNYRRRKRVYVNYAPLPKEVKVGGLIMLHDGKRNWK